MNNPAALPHHRRTAAPGQFPAAGPVDAFRTGKRFFLFHAWLPLGIFLVLQAVATLGHGDQWIADRIYDWGGRSWVLREAFPTKHVIHVAGRNLSAAMWLLALSAWMAARTRARWRHLRRPLACLLAATLLSTLLVAWIKSWSNMDCPWDLLRYGGQRPYVELFALRPIGLQRGACFPAGHASSGYAWVALYFFLIVVRPSWRWLGLAAGLGLGLVFGISQQLRGAHFLSHDVYTAAICWATALSVHLAAWRGPFAGTESPASATIRSGTSV